MTLWQLWCIAAVLLLVVEMFTRRLWFLCVAIGAALAGVAGMAAVGGGVTQLLVFGGATLLSALAVRPAQRGMPSGRR
jgi:membrane protein implicated in regulation of membrane protease activity